MLNGSESRALTSEILGKGGQDIINKSKIARQSVTDSVLNSIQRDKFLIESKEIVAI